MPALPPITLVFMGTADLAAHVLSQLASWPGGRILGVVSQPDKPKGRDLQLQPTPVKQVALAHQFPLFQPEKARAPEFLQQLREIAPDLIVVAAYGQLLPQALLDIPRFGCLNVHTSLLPRYRGAAPIQWAIANGDTETGVTLMRMDAGLDTGPIVSTTTTPITAADNGQTLHDRLAELGAKLLLDTLPGYVTGAVQPRPQPADGVTLARRIRREDGRIDWTHAARSIHNRLRAFTPWPGAYCQFVHGTKSKLLKVHAAEVVEMPNPGKEPGTILSADKSGIVVACGSDSLRLLELQPEGSRRLTAAEFLAGHSLTQLS